MTSRYSTRLFFIAIALLLSFSTGADEVNAAAGYSARRWADEVIAHVLEVSGVDLLELQKIMVYDLLYARAKFMSVSPEKPQVIWLRVDHGAGATSLLQWIKEVREARPGKNW